MTEPVSFHLKNIGAVQDAEFLLRPGVNRLLGPNGSSKTTTLHAISRSLGGADTVEVRDGAIKGTVTSPQGVLLTVGKVCRATGRSELRLADTSPVSTLIDPQLKSSDVAAQARIKALLELVDLPVSEETFKTLADGDEDLVDGLMAMDVPTGRLSNLIEVSAAVRKLAHSAARIEEEHRDSARAEAEVWAQRRSDTVERLPDGVSIEELPEPGSNDDLSSRLDDTIRAGARAQIEADAREELERWQAEARETMGERPDETEAENRESELDDAARALERKISKLQIELATREAERDAAEQVHAGIADACLSWDRQAEILEREATGATREEAEAIEATAEELREELKIADLADEYRKFTGEISAHNLEAIKSANRAEALRSIAATVTDRLGEMLEDAGLEGLTVSDGRLYATKGDKFLDFETRLSEGQRTRIALDLAAKAYGEHVMPLEGRFWQALDPSNRQEFHELAVEMGLVVLTEEPAGGELRVETYSEDSTDGGVSA